MKFQRQAKILDLIDRFEIETQEDLTAHLRALGYNTTQATISRDIKELRLIKTLSSETGKYKYTSSNAGAADSFTTRLRNIFRECVTDIDAAQNMVVIKHCPVWDRRRQWRLMPCAHPMWSARSAATIPYLPLCAITTARKSSAHRQEIF